MKRSLAYLGIVLLVVVVCVASGPSRRNQREEFSPRVPSALGDDCCLRCGVHMVPFGERIEDQHALLQFQTPYGLYEVCVDELVDALVMRGIGHWRETP